MEPVGSNCIKELPRWLDDEGKITNLNAAKKAIELFASMPFLTIIHPDDAKNFFRMLENTNFNSTQLSNDTWDKYAKIFMEHASLFPTDPQNTINISCKIGGKTIETQIPKNHLLAMSETYRTMFTYELTETQEKKIEWDIDRYSGYSEPEALSYLEFLKSGTLTLTKDNVVPILCLAEERKVECLKTKCVSFIRDNMDETDLPILLEMSVRMDLPELPLLCLCFMMNNKVDVSSLLIIEDQESVNTLSSDLEKMSLEDKPKPLSVNTLLHNLEKITLMESHLIPEINKSTHALILNKIEQLTWLEKLNELVPIIKFQDITLSEMEITDDQISNLFGYKIINSIKNITISCCNKITVFRSDTLKNILFDRCEELTDFSTKAAADEIVLYACPKLKSFSSANNVRSIKIEKCLELTNFSTGAGADEILLEDCSKLRSFTDNNIKKIKIVRCEELTTFSTEAAADEILLESCPKLIIVTANNTKKMMIVSCEELTTFSTEAAADEIVFSCCPKLIIVTADNTKKIVAYCCPGLKHMLS